MAANSIRILRSVRRRSVEEARSALGACLATEAQAVDAFEAIVEQARRDRAAHQTVEEPHQFLEMFVRRSGVAEAERLSAEAALTAARARSEAARIAVVAAQTAAEAVETLIAARALSDEEDANRREQHALDDMTRTRFNPADRGAAR
jgi:VIT1/CCC1 family predicted Fe2+/Mn2+ transporter